MLAFVNQTEAAKWNTELILTPEIIARDIEIKNFFMRPISNAIKEPNMLKSPFSVAIIIILFSCAWMIIPFGSLI